MPNLSSFYLLTGRSFNFYLKTEDFKKKHAYIFTHNFRNNYVITEDFKKKAAYFFTNSYKSYHIITQDFKKKAAYFLTNSTISSYFFTEELDTSAYPNICHYPKELDIIRQNAVLLIWKEAKNKLKESLSDELYELRKQIDSGDVVNVEDVSLPNLRELFWEISLDDEKKEEINQFIHSGREIQKLYIATFLILYS